jgi:GMP synthase (glutamine-hydrolysing)
MGAYDDVRHPWLTPTKRLIAHTINEGDKPFLGICLGHQLAAVAVGGTVTPNPAGTTIGITPVGVTVDGASDPLLGRGGASPRAMHWNDDIVATLPPVHRVLARSPDGQIQAVRYGPNAYGVQFHPEVSPAVFASWGISSGLAENPGPAASRIAVAQDELAGAAGELRATWRPVAEAFAVDVHTPVSGRSAG